MQSISVHGNSSLGLCFYQSLETWQIVPGSSCSLSCDIFSSWTEISSSPDTWTPLTFRENSHSFLHPVQCRSRGSASDVNWKTSCFLGIFIAAIKATSARTNFKCLQIDFLKEFTLLGVISCAFSCKMKETIDLPWATENEIEKKEKKRFSPCFSEHNSQRNATVLKESRKTNIAFYIGTSEIHDCTVSNWQHNMISSHVKIWHPHKWRSFLITFKFVGVIFGSSSVVIRNLRLSLKNVPKCAETFVSGFWKKFGKSLETFRKIIQNLLISMFI